MKYRMKDGTVLELRTQLPTGRHEKRVSKLEIHLQSAVAEADRPVTHQEWLEMFQLYARQGLFDNEPDFPQALQEYQEAIRLAAEDPLQHYFPPPEFMPHASEPFRLSYWREGRSFPDIITALQWLAAMYDRLIRQAPGISLAEWNSLKTWLQTHAPELQRDSRVSDVLQDDDLKLPDLLRRVNANDGKSIETSKLIRQLRRLWACCYGT